MKIFRLIRTASYLKPIQIIGRLRFYLYNSSLETDVLPTLLPFSGRWQSPAAKSPSMLSADTFCFLGQTGTLVDACSWNRSSQDKLWLYNLHYFDDLNALDAASRKDWHLDLLLRWVKENPPTIGNGWEPYPTSLRTVNWVKWTLAGNDLPPECATSLFLQVRWLSKRLEWHLLGNHLFANAKALVFAGLFFEGEEAERWLQKGLKIIALQLPEQVLPDGGNFELSTMYHSIFLEDVLDLLNIAGAGNQVSAAVVESWRLLASRMLYWLQAMLHPDGDISLFNDAAIGIAPSFRALTSYASRLAVPLPPPLSNSAVQLLHLPDSGYVRLAAPQAIALLDVARVGPDYLPGHAHADTLCFELSVFGTRFVVNGGTSRYGLGIERERERSTAWHSTVEVDGTNSSEVWGGFRVGRRAYPFGLHTSANSLQLDVTCAHDGYRFLSGKPIHTRAWRMDSSSFTVTDTVSNPALPAIARFIFHPNITLLGVDKRHIQALLPNQKCVNITIIDGEANIENAFYSPSFGVLLETSCLFLNMIKGKSSIKFTWN